MFGECTAARADPHGRTNGLFDLQNSIIVTQVSFWNIVEQFWS